MQTQGHSRIQKLDVNLNSNWRPNTRNISVKDPSGFSTRRDRAKTMTLTIDNSSNQNIHRIIVCVNNRRPAGISGQCLMTENLMLEIKKLFKTLFSTPPYFTSLQSDENKIMKKKKTLDFSVRTKAKCTGCYQSERKIYLGGDKLP